MYPKLSLLFFTSDLPEISASLEVLLFREKALRNFGYNISFIV